ncbi:hypothetical protein F442_22404, partial [Phytophthora nicotianae P10297]
GQNGAVVWDDPTNPLGRVRVPHLYEKLVAAAGTFVLA